MDEIPKLAGLDGLIGRSAWVLGSTQPQIKNAGVRISLTIGDLDNIWGAVFLDEEKEDNEAHYLLSMNRGFIIQSSSNEHSHVLDSETECY
ncbi:uncharacterized protein N7483_006222 [Penicillium malachiteum]|uniref:uncharacterized protein n=1 Tax=Penicillium malachiteum TaxID=1324776 RepID=UPI002547A5FF|nr:uncharacterized protein N7483_006222 [Penicillium malachiteum]KAJ5731714.1 hypothetical protein N7483_006222 [Penicillium malachiteum]